MNVSDVSTAAASVPGVDAEALDSAQKTGSPATPTKITKGTDAPASYKYSNAPSGEDVENFLTGFAQNNQIYSLINTINNSLQAIVRESRETEATIRINQYINQFETALEKRDEILKAADEIKDLKMEALDKRKGLAIASFFFAGDDQLFGAASKLVENNAARLDVLAADVQTRLEAIKTELDAQMNLEKQKGDLANSQISLLDNLNNTFASLIKELHGSHSGTIGSLAKTHV